MHLCDEHEYTMRLGIEYFMEINEQFIYLNSVSHALNHLLTVVAISLADATFISLSMSYYSSGN